MDAWSYRLRLLIRVAPVAAALVVLLTLVALASGAAGGHSNVPSIPGPPPAFFDFAFTLVVLAAAGLLLLSVHSLRRRPVPRSPRDRWWLLRTIAGIAAATGIAVLVSTRLHFVRHHPGDQGQAGRAQHLPADARPRDARSVRFRWEVAAIGGALLLLAGAVLAFRRRNAGTPPSELEAELPEALSAAFDDSLDDLRRERDARRAVIAAYARAERVLAVQGLPRNASEAPLEYLSRVLLGLRVRASAVLELTELFERAKFSPHRIDETMKADAIAALVAVRDDLSAGATP